MPNHIYKNNFANNFTVGFFDGYEESYAKEMEKIGIAVGNLNHDGVPAIEYHTGLTFGKLTGARHAKEILLVLSENEKESQNSTVDENLKH